MRTSEHTDKIFGSLSSFQGGLRGLKANSINPFFKSKYIDLSSIWEALKERLQENGLSFIQEAITLPEGVGVNTRICHSSGQWIEMGPLVIPLGKRDAHSTGSATTYARRYALAAAIGIVSEEDDDGNRAKEAAPKIEELITNEQYENILQILGECSTEYVDKVESSLEKNFNITNMALLPRKYYNRVMTGAMKNSGKADPLGMLRGNE